MHITVLEKVREGIEEKIVRGEVAREEGDNPRKGHAYKSKVDT